jgi:hypothetical protein
MQRMIENLRIGPYAMRYSQFVPWAAYANLRDGRSFLLEQHDLTEALRAQPLENPHRLSYESIQRMAGAEEIRLPID